MSAEKNDVVLNVCNFLQCAQLSGASHCRFPPHKQQKTQAHRSLRFQLLIFSVRKQSNFESISRVCVSMTVEIDAAICQVEKAFVEPAESLNAEPKRGFLQATSLQSSRRAATNFVGRLLHKRRVEGDDVNQYDGADDKRGDRLRNVFGHPLESISPPAQKIDEKLHCAVDRR